MLADTPFLPAVRVPREDVVAVEQIATIPKASLDPDPIGSKLSLRRIGMVERAVMRAIGIPISDEEADLYEAIKAGASGYLLKEISIEEVLFQNNLQGMLFWKRGTGDMTHVNDIEELSLRTTGGRDLRFAYDNETPRHETLLQSHELASRLVTNAEFAAFIADGGYRRSELWLSAGWATVAMAHSVEP